MTVEDLVKEENVRDHIPLEQGLRPSRALLCAPGNKSQRPYSIRTRIKTTLSVYRRLLVRSQRPYSIRTRIKTYLSALASDSTGVRDHIPLEQGLRRGRGFNPHSSRHVRDHIPLEQGLRPLALKDTAVVQMSETIFH